MKAALLLCALVGLVWGTSDYYQCGPNSQGEKECEDDLVCGTFSYTTNTTGTSYFAQCFDAKYCGEQVPGGSGDHKIDCGGQYGNGPESEMQKLFNKKVLIIGGVSIFVLLCLGCCVYRKRARRVPAFAERTC